MKRLKTVVITLLLALILITSNILSLYIGLTDKTERDTEGESIAAQDIYTVEIWEGGEVHIITTVRYLNQLSEHTVLITDRSLDDVQQEILDMMDEVRNE